MAGKRDLAAKFLYGTGAVHAISALRPWAHGPVTILAYHRVLDVPDEEAFPYDIELVSATSASFERQMEFVREHFTPITFETLLACLDSGEPPPRKAAIVTFDDGFADNYSNAFPVLRRLGMPATIFLSTGYIDRQETFWYERLAYAVMTTRVRSLQLSGVGNLTIGESASSRREVIKALLRWMKRVPDIVRREALAELDVKLGATGDRGGDDRSGPMNWEQVREMSRAGIEFGSHTVSHPVLSMLEPAQLALELEASKARIEAVLDRPVQVIAYPVGGEDAFNDDVRAAVRAAGYRLGVSYIPGVGGPANWDPLALRRLSVERYVGQSLFAATMVLPEVFSY